MTADTVRTLAQSDPVPQITATWGQLAAETRKAVDTLTTKLRELDRVQEQLQERGLTVSTDLGPVGNAAHAALKTADDHRADHASPTFELPRAS